MPEGEPAKPRNTSSNGARRTRPQRARLELEPRHDLTRSRRPGKRGGDNLAHIHASKAGNRHAARIPLLRGQGVAGIRVWEEDAVEHVEDFSPHEKLLALPDPGALAGS